VRMGKGGCKKREGKGEVLKYRSDSTKSSAECEGDRDIERRLTVNFEDGKVGWEEGRGGDRCRLVWGR